MGTVDAGEAVDFVSVDFFAAASVVVVAVDVDDDVLDVEKTVFAVGGVGAGDGAGARAGAGEDVVLSSAVLVLTASN